MVSEPHRHTYAAAVSGEASQPVQQPPPQVESSVAPQRSATPRIPNFEELDNPLFLSPSDNPNMVLVSPPLMGSSNYGAWSISMRIALEVKNKWGFVEGTVPKPSRDQAEFGAWRRCNLIVCAWIFRSVHSSIAGSILHIDDAHDIWYDLSSRFSRCDAQRISVLQDEIFSLRQHNLSINDYYTKCKTLWEELNMLRPLPVCRCVPKCSCTLVEEIRKERDLDCVIRFLQGLNEDYASLKASVLVLDPLPEVFKVFVMAENWKDNSL